MIDRFWFKALSFVEETQTTFEWSQGLLVLAVTAVVLAGLAMVEAVHQPKRRGAKAMPAPSSGAATQTSTAQLDSDHLQDLPWYERVAWGRGALAGFLGTVVMTVFFSVVATLGAPKLEPAVTMASLMGNSLLLGWIAHFAIGTMMAHIYAMWFSRTLPGPFWFRGAVFGLLPFFIVQLIMSPLMGGGVFSSAMEQAGMMVFLSLAGHVFYGVVVGGIYGNPFKDELAPA